MQLITIDDFESQVFTALLDNTRAEFLVSYNTLCDRWYIELSVDDVCVGSFKVIDRSLLIRGCGPSDFGDLVALPRDATDVNLGRTAFSADELRLYYVTPAEAEILQANGY